MRKVPRAAQFGDRTLSLAGPALRRESALWISILATIVQFWSIRRVAAMLLVPYLAWVSFASLLNAEIARRNPPAG